MVVGETLLTQYGYFGLFILLALGIILAPIPDEIMLIVAGYFTQLGKLGFTTTLIVCVIGSVCGLMMSYLIGKKVGRAIVNRYGKWIGLKEKRMKRVENWIKRFGSYFILFSCFIPGVRHLTGYLCGVSKLSFKTYLLYVTIGSSLWCFLLIMFGRYITSIYFA